MLCKETGRTRPTIAALSSESTDVTETDPHPETAGKWPTPQQVVELLTGGTRPREWSMLIVNRTNESQIFCSWCQVAFRGWRNDLLGHIRSKTHQKKATGAMHRFLPQEPPAKRTATEVTITAKELFLSRAYLHAESCGISYTAMFNLLSDPFLRARKAYDGTFPTPTHARNTYFPTAATLVSETVDSLIGAGTVITVT